MSTDTIAGSVKSTYTHDEWRKLEARRQQLCSLCKQILNEPDGEINPDLKDAANMILPLVHRDHNASVPDVQVETGRGTHD